MEAKFAEVGDARAVPERFTKSAQAANAAAGPVSAGHAGAAVVGNGLC